MSYIYIRVTESVQLIVNPDCPNRLLTEHIRRQIMKECPEILGTKAFHGAPRESWYMPSRSIRLSDENGGEQEGQYEAENKPEKVTPKILIEENGVPTQVDLIKENGNICGLFFHKEYDNPFELGLLKEGETYYAVLFECTKNNYPSKPSLLLAETLPNYGKLLNMCVDSIEIWIDYLKKESTGKKKNIYKLERDVEEDREIE